MQLNTAHSRRGFFWGGKLARLSHRTAALQGELSLLEKSLVAYRPAKFWTPFKTGAAGFLCGAATSLAWVVWLLSL